MNKQRIAEEMIKTGGAFVQHLGRALQVADPANTEKIRQTWPVYWVQYEILAKLSDDNEEYSKEEQRSHAQRAAIINRFADHAGPGQRGVCS